MNPWKAVLLGLVACVFAVFGLTPGDPGHIPDSSAEGAGPGTTHLTYPFEDRNMFFGLSAINPKKHAAFVQDLGFSWLSLQPTCCG